MRLRWAQSLTVHSSKFHLHRGHDLGFAMSSMLVRPKTPSRSGSMFTDVLSTPRDWIPLGKSKFAMFAAIKTLVAELETPHYTVEPQDTDKPLPYEVRNYAASTWVTTSESSIEAPSADGNQTKNRRSTFFKLFDYISGKNDKKQKIEMTVPVLKKITPGAGPFCETTKDMSFYVTKEFQGSPPVPSSEDVHVTHLPAQRVVVKSFSGYTSEAKDLEEARALAELTQDKYELEQDFYFTAGYNSPWRVVGRRNEVWFVIKGNKENGEASSSPEMTASAEGSSVDKSSPPAGE